MSLILGYPLSLGFILQIALFYIGCLLALVILLFLLRIEERGFDYKYVKGIFVSLTIYLASINFYILSKSQISLYNSFYISVYFLHILLALVFITYTLKIIYNKLIKNEQARYPTVFFVLIVSILLSRSAIDGIHNSLNLIYNLTLFILGIAFFIYYDWLKNWFNSDPKKDSVNQSNKENSILGYISREISLRKERFFNRDVAIEKSEYSLNDEIRNSIKNSKCLDLENRDLKQLKFMLVCANQEVETIKNESSRAQNFTITGFTLMLVPSLIILYSFFGGLLDFQIYLTIKTLNIEPILERVFEQILFRFDSSTRMLTLILIIYISAFIFMSFHSLIEPNGKVNYWIKRRKITNVLYEILQIIVISSLLIGGVLSSKLDLTDRSLNINLLSGVIGLMFYIIGSLIISLNRRDLINANKIILDLNNKIIFYEKKE